MQILHWLILMACCFVTSCSRSSGTVVFVAPDKFSGLFLVVEDEKADRTVKKEHGENTFIIPSNGKVIVRDASVLTKLHKLTVRYENGDVLEFGEIHPHRGYSVWPLGHLSDVGFFLFIGSPSDCEAMRKQGNLERLPLGTPIDDATLRSSWK